MSDENKALARRFREAIDRHDWSVFDELVARDCTAHMAGNPEPLGREEMRRLIEIFYSAFPNLRHRFDDQIAEGDKVFTRITFEDTHEGEFQGIPPSGRKITVEAFVVDRYAEGKLVEHWANFDNLSLLRQMGALPEPASAG